MKADPVFLNWQVGRVVHIETILDHFLPAENAVSPVLTEAMRYAVLGGGKRLRALLVYGAAALGNSASTSADRAAAAVECIHAYSLVHDDMPEMDNDALRRGKPSCHVRYGQSWALLAGDALQTLAFEILSNQSELPADRRLVMIRELAKASGSSGMAGGQAIDLEHVGEVMSLSRLETMHRLKTGALIRASVLLGALACEKLDGDVLARLGHYADLLGLAFQVVDDVLDYEQGTEVLGKTAGKDEAAGKPTFVSLLGINEARHYARKTVDEAFLVLSDFDERADMLRGLTATVINRTH